MKSKFIIIILLIAVVALLLFLRVNNGKTVNTPPTSESSTTTASTNEVRSGKIDEHLTIDNTLKDVNFCGKTYKTRQVIIDDVDVVQRIAELAKQEVFISKNPPSLLGEIICKHIEFNSVNEIPLGQVTKYVNKDGHATYNLFIFNSFGFHIDSTIGDIYLIGAFDGSLTGPIGKLK